MAIKSEENAVLLRRYAETKDVAVRNEIVARNYGLVGFVVKRRFPFLMANADFDQAMSDGGIGLIRAVECFKTSANTKFSTYATQAIWSHILRGMKNRYSLRGLRSPAADMPTLMHISAMQTDADGGSVNDMLADRKSFLDSDRMSTTEREDLHRIIEELPEREAAVVRMRYFMEMDLAQVGQVLGVVRERVRQIEMKGLQKLRQMMDPDWDGKPFKRKRKKRNRVNATL